MPCRLDDTANLLQLLAVENMVEHIGAGAKVISASCTVR